MVALLQDYSLYDYSETVPDEFSEMGVIAVKLEPSYSNLNRALNVSEIFK